MLQLVVGMIPEVANLIKDAIRDPETYEQVEMIRQLIEKLTGKEIPKNGLVALLEATTQGEPFTGKWEGEEEVTIKRARIDGGWMYDPGRGNCITEMDK